MKIKWNKNNIMDDEIMAELRQIKQAIAREHDYDVQKLGESLMEEQKQHGDKLVNLTQAPKRNAQAAAHE